MNVYDFDKTIYKGDSTLDFYLYCVKKQPILILIFPIQILGFIRYKLGLITKLQFKEVFYSFLKYVNDVEGKIDDFWRNNEFKIQSWYLKQQRSDDIIISASPEFLLQPICEKVGVANLIASIVDIRTGKCLSENCYGIEKIKRYQEIYGDLVIHEFYSDSLTDTPLAEMAKKSFGVDGDKLIPWNDFKKTSTNSSIQKEFLLFVIVGVINTCNGVLFASLFSLILNSTVAFIFGYGCSLIVSYILNSKFVFKHTLSFMKFIKFCISYIPNFLIQFVMVFVFVHFYHLYEIVVYTISAALAVPITFLMVKFFALKK